MGSFLVYICIYFVSYAKKNRYFDFVSKVESFLYDIISKKLCQEHALLPAIFSVNIAQ